MNDPLDDEFIKLFLTFTEFLLDQDIVNKVVYLHNKIERWAFQIFRGGKKPLRTCSVRSGCCCHSTCPFLVKMLNCCNVEKLPSPGAAVGGSVWASVDMGPVR